ncbi:MAG: Ig-like domain-containing protein [Nocardioides sp.]|jgi:hypothetical protein
MRISRLVAGTVSAGLLGLVPVAVSAPAQAATVATATSLESYSNAVEFGNTVTLSGNVTDAAGGGVYTGTVTLYAMSSKNPTWAAVGTDADGGYFSFTVKPRSNTAYKAVYAGGASTTDQYTGSESAPVAVGVARKVTVSLLSKSLTVKLKVKPEFKKGVVKAFIKKGGKYRFLKKVRANKKGVAYVKLPAPRRGKKLYFKLKIAKNKHYLGWQDAYYTSAY